MIKQEYDPSINLLLQAASEDYIGARVCFHESLISSGYVLSQQALEKIMKVFIWLLKPDEKVGENPRYFSHDLFFLCSLLEDASCCDFSQYHRLCRTLTPSFFFFRYPSSNSLEKVSDPSFSLSILHEVDEMFIHMYILLPIPEHIKKYLILCSYLRNPKLQRFKTHIVKSNRAYQNHSSFFERLIKDV